MPGIERRTNDAQEPKTLGVVEAYKSITGTITCIRTRNGDDDKLRFDLAPLIGRGGRIFETRYESRLSSRGLFEESKRTTR